MNTTTSFLPVLYGTFKKTLKELEIHLHQSMSHDQVTDFSVSILRRMYINNASKQICGSHGCIVFLAL